MLLSHSKNWYTLKSKIDRLKEYKSNFINDWEHKKSLKLVDYADFIGIEDINFKSFHNMVDKGRSKIKKSWYRVGEFISNLDYKLDWYKVF
ncbi:MAG: hypothetical protein LBB45_08825 [Methanobrevibacter sp.]|jgi:transposase|nr:hypothetical protein [Candidatus Methanovirga basalitermitum]